MISKRKAYTVAAIVVGVVVLAVGVAVFTKRLRLQSPVVVIPQGGQVVTNSNRVPTVEWFGANGLFNNLQDVSGGTAIEQISYQQALQTYQNTHMVLDPNCRVRPVTMVVPIKSVVMLDNQSKWQRSIIVGPRTYTIMPYNYVLAAFNTPGGYAITCDSLQNVGIITVTP